MAQRDSEGMIISCGLLVIVISVLGAAATNMTPISFLIAATFATLLGSLVVGAVVFAFAVLYTTYKQSSGTGVFGIGGDEKMTLQSCLRDIKIVLRVPLQALVTILRNIDSTDAGVVLRHIGVECAEIFGAANQKWGIRKRLDRASQPVLGALGRESAARGLQNDPLGGDLRRELGRMGGRQLSERYARERRVLC
ncbi:MAG: hypothetical protein EOM26_01580 [Alphaproteobacteria bacterium]|nr:hypothetical protein [Alphaproteobacteria bacterium]